MTHTGTIVTKPPGGNLLGANRTTVTVFYFPSDDPEIAAKQAAKIDRLTDRIIRVGDGHQDDDE
jgi:hypothetical protein